MFGGFGSLASGFLPARISRRWVAVGCFTLVFLMLMLLPNVRGVGPAIAIMALISFTGDITVPISWNTCVEVGKRYTATVAAAMNMFANFSGFVAPFVGGYYWPSYYYPAPVYRSYYTPAYVYPAPAAYSSYYYPAPVYRRSYYAPGYYVWP